MAVTVLDYLKANPASVVVIFIFKHDISGKKKEFAGFYPYDFLQIWIIFSATCSGVNGSVLISW